MGEPIVSKMNKTIMKYIQAANYTLQHLQNSRPDWTPDNSDINWPAYDRWNARNEECYETGGEHEAPVGHAHDSTIHISDIFERWRHDVPVQEGDGSKWARAT
jgi:hypothetical protein